MSDRAKLIVHLDRLDRNYRRIQEKCNKPIIAMVKANAYGHGLIEVSEFLTSNLKVNNLGVASIHEALELRTTLNRFDFRIFVFSNLELEQNLNSYLDEKLIPVISSMEDLTFFLNSKTKSLPLVIKFNTGMNRIGIDSSNLNKVIDLLKKSNRVSIDHLMTHLADTFQVEPRVYPKQIETFKEIKESFKSSGIEYLESSISNSALIEKGVETDDSHIRVGLMLYGASSFKDSSWNGEIISDLEASILDLKKISRDEHFGYGPTYTKNDQNLAIINIGYGDGLPYLNKRVSIPITNGKLFLTGRINMDMSFVDLPLKSSLKKGDRIQLWGSNPRQFTEVCSNFRTIPYTLLSQLTSRLCKEYRLG